MVAIAGHVEINAADDSLMIDGEEFPWFVNKEGITVDYRDGSAPIVTVQIIAKSIHVGPKARQ